MDSAEHYAEAQRLLATPQLDDEDPGLAREIRNTNIAAAAAHARLAAVALEAELRIDWSGAASNRRQLDWREVLGHGS